MDPTPIRLAVCLLLLTVPGAAAPAGAGSQESAEQVRALTESGRAALADGRREEAESLLRRAVALDPRSQAAQLYGSYLGSQGRFAEAVEVLKPFVAAHPEDRGSALAMAMASLQVGATEDAALALEGLPPEDPAAGLLRAELALRRGEVYRAREVLESVWGARPPALDLDMRRLLGEVYVTIGQAAEAVELLSGFEGDRPGLAILLSRAHYQAGDAEAAAEVLRPFERAIEAVDERSPEEQIVQAVGIATELGRALVALERAPGAEEALRRAARLRPSNAEIWNVLAHALIAQGKMAEAREAVGRYHHLSKTPLTDE